MFKPHPHTCDGTLSHPELDTQKYAPCFRPPGHTAIIDAQTHPDSNHLSDYSHLNTPSDRDTNIASITGKTTNVTDTLLNRHADTHPVLQTSCQPHRHTQTLLKERLDGKRKKIPNFQQGVK